MQDKIPLSYITSVVHSDQGEVTKLLHRCRHFHPQIEVSHVMVKVHKVGAGQGLLAGKAEENMPFVEIVKNETMHVVELLERSLYVETKFRPLEWVHVPCTQAVPLASLFQKG